MSVDLEESETSGILSSLQAGDTKTSSLLQCGGIKLTQRFARRMPQRGQARQPLLAFTGVRPNDLHMQPRQRGPVIA